MKRLLLPIIICSVAVTAGLLTQIRGAEEEAGATGTQTESPRTPSASLSPAALALPNRGVEPAEPEPRVTWAPQWTLGERRRYRYDSTHKVSVTIADAPASAATVTVGGRWVTTVAGIDGDQIHLRVELEEPTLRLTPEESPESTDRTRAALRTPFYASYNTHGRLEALHFPTEMESFAQTIARSVAASMQLVAPETAVASRWQTEESDPMGEYTASYTHVGPGARFDRRKSDYVRVASAHGLVPASDAGSYTIEGSSRLEADEKGQPKTVRTDETVRMNAKAAGAAMASTMRVRAKLLDISRDAGAAADLEAAWAGLRSTQVPDIDRIRQQAALKDEKAVGHTTFTAQLGTLRSLFRPEDGRARALLMADIAAMIRLRPDTAKDAANLVRAGTESLATERALLGALSAAGTPEANAALAGVLGDESLDRDARIEAAGSLGLSQKPDADSLEALQGYLDASDDALRTTATLAVGNQLESLEDESARRAGVDDLLKRLAEAEGQDRENLLEALGNSGASEALSTLKETLQTATGDTRDAAIRALRFMEGDDASALLNQLLTGGDPTDQASALAAARYRPLDEVLDALGSIVKGSEDTALRREALTQLAKHPNDPAALALLQHAAANDADETLRQQVTETLAEAPIPSPAE